MSFAARHFWRPKALNCATEKIAASWCGCCAGCQPAIQPATSRRYQRSADWQSAVPRTGSPLGGNFVSRPGAVQGRPSPFLREFHAAMPDEGMSTIAKVDFGQTNPFSDAPRIAINYSYTISYGSGRPQESLASFWKRTHFDDLHNRPKSKWTTDLMAQPIRPYRAFFDHRESLLMHPK